MQGAGTWESLRNAKGTIGSRETSVAMAAAGLQLLRLAGRFFGDTPLWTSLSGCPNQSTEKMICSNAGFAMRAVPGAWPPDRNRWPPVRELDMTDSGSEEHESEQTAWRVHQKHSTRGASQDHSIESHLVKKFEEIAGIASNVVNS